MLSSFLLFCSVMVSMSDLPGGDSLAVPGILKKAVTTSDCDYMTSDEKQVIYYLNVARLYPAHFSELLRTYVAASPFHKAKNSNYVNSLKSELKVMKPLPPLLPDKAMWELARCWATEAGNKGLTGHNRKKCKTGYMGECCQYGVSDPLGIVMELMIDEGIPSLGHRRICLGNFKSVGVSIQPHKKYGINAVLDFK